MAEAGLSQRAIADRLNADGMPAVGGRWRRCTVIRIPATGDGVDGRIEAHPCGSLLKHAVGAGATYAVKRSVGGRRTLRVRLRCVMEVLP